VPQCLTWLGHEIASHGRKDRTGTCPPHIGDVSLLIARGGDEAWNVDYGWRWMLGSETLPAILVVFVWRFVPETKEKSLEEIERN